MKTAAILDGIARIMSDAIADSHIYAAGTTQSVLDNAPLVVPIAEDFLQDGGVAGVLCTLGDWHPILQPGNERFGNANPLVIHCSVWRELGIDLGQVVNLLLADRDEIADAFIAHTKAYLTDGDLQAAILAGGPGLVPRTIGSGENARAFLTLPFDVNVSLNRTVVPQPA
jgi:hypothetical protein